MKRLIVLFIISALFSTEKLYAQNVFLGIDSSGAILGVPEPDTVNAYDTASYYVWVKNYGPGNFNGVIYLNTAVDTSAGLNLAGIDSIGPVVLPAGMSLPVTLTETYSTGPYRIGGNIVVIWPSALAPNVYTQDSSAVHNVVVLGNVSVAEFDNEYNLTLYPNPTNSDINLANKGSGIIVEKVRIMDVLGKELKSMKHVSSVDMSELPQGVYFLEATFDNNIKKTFKIIKQNK